MIDHVGELMEAGLNSLKLEGRAKSAYYAAIVTGAYRHAIDAAAAGCPWTRCGGTRWSTSATATTPPASTTASRGSLRRTPGTSGTGRLWQRCSPATGEGNALLTLNNKFSTGDTLELVGPDVRPVSFQVGELRDEEGNVLEQVRKPQMRFT